MATCPTYLLLLEFVQMRNVAMILFDISNVIIIVFIVCKVIKIELSVYCHIINLTLAHIYSVYFIKRSDYSQTLKVYLKN